jgi:hypothetical protein
VESLEWTLEAQRGGHRPRAPCPRRVTEVPLRGGPVTLDSCARCSAAATYGACCSDNLLKLTSARSLG